jgi:hypothetical protein
MSQNIFADEWRDCLRAHYMHVIRTADHITEPTLRDVLKEAGFSESELAELRVRATMHVDDVGPDFVPDLRVFTAVQPQPFPDPIPEAGDEMQSRNAPDEPGEDEALSDELPDVLLVDEMPPEDDEMPRQLSLF